jgi:DNA-binding NtrC family response regulator
VVTIWLPPLRERREDIPGLVGHFLKLYSEENFRQPPPRIEPATMRALLDYSWPGNVRELQNYIERAVVLAPGDALTADLLPEALRGGKPRRIGRAADPETLASELVRQGIDAAGPGAENLHTTIVNRVERELIAQVMAACEGVQIKAAERLGISRNTLHKKLKEFGLET